MICCLVQYRCKLMCYFIVLGCQPPGVLWCDRLSGSGLLFLLPESQPLEDDSPKALPVLGEQSNSDNDINEPVFIWGISDKAAQRKSISAGERSFRLQQEKQQPLVHRPGRGKGRLRLPHVSSAWFSGAGNRMLGGGLPGRCLCVHLGLCFSWG